MKSFLYTLKAIVVSLILVLPLCVSAQGHFKGQGLSISVAGTSSLHDWEMKSSKVKVDATITVSNDKVNVSALSFSMPVETLKSGNGMMDKNTYKAMDTKKNPNVSFVLTNVNSMKLTAPNTYTLAASGKLTIAGFTKATDISATLKYNPTDKSFTCTGTKKIKMSEYGVKPPTALLGTVKTGDNISISYTINIKS